MLHHDCDQATLNAERPETDKIPLRAEDWMSGLKLALRPIGFHRSSRERRFPPALRTRTSGFRTASSSWRCRSLSRFERRSCSSYSAIVLSNSPTMSSAAAVRRSFTSPLSTATADMFKATGLTFTGASPLKPPASGVPARYSDVRPNTTFKRQNH